MSKKAKRSTNVLLPGLEEFDSAMMGNFENDPTLESELLAIMGGAPEVRKPKSTKKDVKKTVDIGKNLLNLDLNDDEDVGDIDEDDPELLAELNDMLVDDEPVHEDTSKKSCKSTVSSESVKSLENLKQLYQAALKDAQSVNDSTKSRRYERTLKLIEDLLRRALKGEQVNESEFPPAVYVKSNTPKVVPENLTAVENTVREVPSPAKITSPAKADVKTQNSVPPPPIQKKDPQNIVLETLIKRQIEYKSAALNAKTKDIELAKGLMMVVKTFDEVIQGVKNGEPFDLENLPPPASQFKLSDLHVEEEEESVASPPKQENSAPKNFGEELNVRQMFYKESLDKAQAEENASKVRRLARVVQQYDEARVAFSKKIAYPYDELPPPPGKSPLPKSGVAASLNVPASTKEPSPNKPQIIVNKTVHTLRQKQAQFKAAALKAKNDGDLPLAKELLRQSMGFDQMIQASESGFPVDLSKVPSLPTETDFNFELVNADVCEMPDDMKTADKQTLFGRLRAALQEQVKTCRTYQQSVMKAGDVIGAKRFESLANSCEKDLHGLLCLIQSDADLPKFHYEFKILAVTRSNPDLGENELAVEVLKAVDLAVPAGLSAEQLDTYVVLELPFPNDAFQTFTTDTVRRTNNPEYGASTKFEVNAKSRVFQRVLKSKQLRADIFYRKGFLQKDKLLGSCGIKMDRLEAACTVHDCFDIVENKKLIGGKLEVRLRLRNAVSGAQSENVKEKWLVIDEFNKNYDKAAAFDRLATVQPVEDLGSVDVLKYEIAEFRRRISEAGSQLTPSLASSVRQKIREKEEAVRKQEQRVNSTDGAVRLSYVQYLAKMGPQYAAEAKKCLAAGNRDKAQSLMTKKKILENEMERLKTKK